MLCLGYICVAILGETGEPCYHHNINKFELHFVRDFDGTNRSKIIFKANVICIN